MEVPKPDFALRPPPLCEAITEEDYIQFIERAGEQVCLSVCLSLNDDTSIHSLLHSDNFA